ncbi:DUF2147 domain-containing protein [Treponema sp. R6D11]
MNKLIVFCVILQIASVCFAQSGGVDPVEGFWISVDDNTGKITAGWQIYQEGGKLYGKILSMADFPKDVIAVPCKESYKGFPVAGKVNAMPVAGTPWIFGLTKGKNGDWSGGSIINPEDGKMFSCKIIFRAADGKKYKIDTLEMRGEIGLGIGRSQFWQKSDAETASGLGPK